MHYLHVRAYIRATNERRGRAAINNKFNILQYVWRARRHKFIFDSFALICTCARNLLHRSAETYFWALVYRPPSVLVAALITTRYFVLRLMTSVLYFMWGWVYWRYAALPVRDGVNAAGANWYRRSRNDGNEPYAPYFSYCRQKDHRKFAESRENIEWLPR